MKHIRLKCRPLVLLAALSVCTWGEAKQTGDRDNVLFIDGVALDPLIEKTAPREYKLDAPSLGLELKEVPRGALYQQQMQGDRIPPGALKIIQDRLGLANRLAQEQRWPEALREVEQALALEPKHPELLRRCAVYASLSRQYALSEGYFKKVVQAVPDNAELQAGWAATLMHLGRTEEALEVCSQALLKAPGNHLVQFNHLVLEIIEGKDPQPSIFWVTLPLPQLEVVANWLNADRVELEPLAGEEGYQKLTSMVVGLAHPDQLPDFLALMRDLREAHQAKETEVYTRKIEELLDLVEHPSLVILMEKTRLLIEAGQFAEAGVVTAGCVETYPDIAWAHYNHGYVLINELKYEAAQSSFLKALERAPDQPPILFALACAYAGGGGMNKAWPILEQLTEQYPERMPLWVKGEKKYLDAIRADARFPDLAKRFKMPETPDPPAAP